ncbi:hypothetical protein B5F23_01655 [Olsenella sp. An188]|nr:hypothetical protein B5F23_01655 [Olsenella sp. An188]
MARTTMPPSDPVTDIPPGVAIVPGPIMGAALLAWLLRPYGEHLSIKMNSSFTSQLGPLFFCLRF